MASYKPHTFSIALFILLMAATASSAQSRRPTGPAAQLPTRVYTSFQKDYSGAKLQSVRQNANNGQPIYELTFIDGGTNKRITYSEYGAMLAHAEEIAPSSIPLNVQGAIQLQCIGCGIVKARKRTEGNNVSYEVTLMVGRSRRLRTEIFNSDGTLFGVK